MAYPLVTDALSADLTLLRTAPARASLDGTAVIKRTHMLLVTPFTVDPVGIGGVALSAMAERIPAGNMAPLTAVLDNGEVVMQRETLTPRSLARIGVITFDQGVSRDERLAAPLLDRLSFHVSLDSGSEPGPEIGDIADARILLPLVTVDNDVVEDLCATATALLNRIEKLRAVAPWRQLRAGSGRTGSQIRGEDFRVRRLKQRSETTVIFLVDALGEQVRNRWRCWPFAAVRPNACCHRDEVRAFYAIPAAPPEPSR